MKGLEYSDAPYDKEYPNAQYVKPPNTTSTTFFIIILTSFFRDTIPDSSIPNPDGSNNHKNQHPWYSNFILFNVKQE